MGVALDCRRVVIAFDVADSVRRKALRGGVPLERIRDERLHCWGGSTSAGRLR
jgi:hypothetical protein